VQAPSVAGGKRRWGGGRQILGLIKVKCVDEPTQKEEKKKPDESRKKKGRRCPWSSGDESKGLRGTPSLREVRRDPEKNRVERGRGKRGKGGRALPVELGDRAVNGVGLRQKEKKKLTTETVKIVELGDS